MVSHETTAAQQFCRAMESDSDDPGPDDPTPGAAGLTRPVVIQAVGREFPVATGYTVYAVRLVVRDGEEEVDAGAAVGGRVTGLYVARSLADGFAAVRRALPLPDATHVVVNDERGGEHYRRAVA